MSVFRDLEKRIDARLKKLFTSEASTTRGRELFEIQRAILEEIEDHSQMMPRARRRFPYNDLTVRITGDAQAIDTVFVQGEALRNEILNHLRSEKIEVNDLKVAVEHLPDPPAELAVKGFQIIYSNREEAKTAASPRTVRMTVVRGHAEQTTTEFSKGRIHLGRLNEVLDDRRRPVRRNDVAFMESGDKPNSTVSRAHAHIEWDVETGEFRLFDDGSTYGTSVLQNGQLLNVPASSGRGLRLQSGDEIYLGQARILFEIVKP